jgi:hypothetical protein
MACSFSDAYMQPVLQVYSRFLGTTILDSQHPCTVPHIVISDCPPQSLWIGHLNGTPPEQDYRCLSPFHGIWGSTRAITTGDNADADSHLHVESHDVLSHDGDESENSDIMNDNYNYYSEPSDVSSSIPTLHDELSALRAGEAMDIVVSDSDLDLIPTPSWEEPDHGPWGADDDPYFRPDTPAPATPPDEGNGMLSFTDSASVYPQHIDGLGKVREHEQEDEGYSLDTASMGPGETTPALLKKSNPFYLDEDEDDLPSLDDW